MAETHDNILHDVSIFTTKYHSNLQLLVHHSQTKLEIGYEIVLDRKEECHKEDARNRVLKFLRIAWGKDKEGIEHDDPQEQLKH
jgi:hypothetical protein